MQFFYRGYNHEEDHSEHMQFGVGREGTESRNSTGKLWRILSEFVLQKQ